MYSNHHQAETTGLAIGRRQGHQVGRQEGYKQGWHDAKAEAQKQIDYLQGVLNSMFILAYPALTTIHHSNDADAQNFFVKNYNDLIQRNGQRIRVVPHQDPGVAQFSPAIAEVVQKWIVAAPQCDQSPSPGM